MPRIPKHLRNRPGLRRYARSTPVSPDPEPEVEPDLEPEPEPEVEPVPADPESMPDYESMTYNELRKLVPSEAEAQMPDKKKATFVAYLTAEWQNAN